MKKALIATNTASMIKLFNQVNIAILQSMGYEIHIACNFNYGNTVSSDAVKLAAEEWREQGIFVHQVDFLRSPFSWKSFGIYRQIKALIDREKFDLIHCHTPIVAAFTRLAAASAQRKGNTRLVYTAHGFHFFKGAPLKNWLLYCPVEKICSYFTDDLITINQEDHHFARRHFSSSNIYYLPGVGVDTEAFSPDALPQDTRDALRKALGIAHGQRMVLSVGEFTREKNYRTAVNAIAKLKHLDVQYVICGQGDLFSEIQEYAKQQNVANRVIFLGYRKDISQICACADVFLHPSCREGLPVAVMEAMACGTPIVASRIRGNVDLVDDGVNGFLCDPEDADAFAGRIQRLLEDPGLAEKFRDHSLEKIKRYDKRIVAEQLQKIYGEVTNHGYAVADKI